jgi:hypothetical protein
MSSYNEMKNNYFRQIHSEIRQTPFSPKFHSVLLFRTYSSSTSTVTAASFNYKKELPKGNLNTMEISKELIDQIMTPEVVSLAALFDKYGYELRMAGGAVR